MKSILLIALLICFHPPERVQTLLSSFSCPGRSQGPPCQEFWFADAVFISTAKEVVTVPWTQSEMPNWQQYQKLTARLAVEETFRGNVGPEITFEMDSCYYPFRQGEKYLVYAHKGQDGKLHQSTDESRTRPLSEAREDLEYIRSLPRAAEGGRIFGKAINHSSVVTLRTNGEPSHLNDPIPGLKIVAEGTEKNYETTTDGAGSFELVGLPEGIYSVRALIPSYFSGGEDKVKLSNRGCAPVIFSIQATGGIAGRVLDANGQPIADMSVSIFSAEGVTNEMIERVKAGYVHRDTTDKQGNFRFVRLPSGRYFIATNLVEKYDAADGATKVYPRTFYPGVMSLSDAAIITLSDGQEKWNIDLKLPPARPLKKTERAKF